MWTAVLFGVFLLLIALTLVLGLFAAARPSPGLRRVRDLCMIGAGLALLAVIVERAISAEPLLWVIAVVLVALLALVAPRLAKQWRAGG